MHKPIGILPINAIDTKEGIYQVTYSVYIMLCFQLLQYIAQMVQS